MNSLETTLKQHPVFSSLHQTDTKTLCQNAIRKNLQKGEFLALQGDIWPYLFLVKEGEINALKTSREGRLLLVTTFGEMDIFWGPAFFAKETPLLATLEASIKSIIYLWRDKDIEGIILKNGRISWELCKMMIQRMQRASDIVEELAFQPVAGRLASLLLDISQGDELRPIPRNLTLDEIAARVGSTREVVCRFLQRFADEGLITITRTEFTIDDQPGLAERARQVKG